MTQIDIYQTSPYAKNQLSLNWQVIKLGKWQGFMRKIPILGTMLKVQRIGNPIPWEEIEEAIKKYNVRKVILEPGKDIDEEVYLVESKKRGYKKASSNFAPGNSILIDISPTTEIVFHNFTEAKQRAIRRAEKNNLTIKITNNPADFIWIKKRSLWEKMTFPFWIDQETKGYNNAFGKDAEFIIAYRNAKPVAGIFQLYSDQTAYYWMAGAIKEGKKLFAPTLLVWEAIKRAKEKKCTVYDFVGIYDSRYPNKDWLGFTKFKEGFGGNDVIYPIGTTKKMGLIG